MNSPDANNPPPLVSVIVVNYNCKNWLDRFFSTLRAQTIFDRVETIMVDNTSHDGSAEICEKEMAAWPGGVFLQTGGNYGFGGGGNRGAAVARGQYFFFLNPDVQLEPDCLEELFTHAEKNKLQIAGPLVLDYDSDIVQGQGAAGFDFFGGLVSPRAGENLTEPFAICAFYFIHRDLFSKLGGFDEEFFLFNEEMDLSWRAWTSGETVAMIRSAKIHHQGASSGERAVENRTNESKRFYANRNQLLALLKNAHFLLLGLVLTQIMLLTAEAMAGWLLAGRLSFVRWSLLKPVAECWRLRRHIYAERKRISGFRRRGDLWIVRRFFRFGFGRVMDVKRLLRHGVKIDPAWAKK